MSEEVLLVCDFVELVKPYSVGVVNMNASYVVANLSQENHESETYKNIAKDWSK